MNVMSGMSSSYYTTNSENSKQNPPSFILTIKRWNISITRSKCSNYLFLQLAIYIQSADVPIKKIERKKERNTEC